MPSRRRGDGLVRALIGVGVLAVVVGILVGWWRPEPRWPRARPAAGGTPR